MPSLAHSIGVIKLLPTCRIVGHDSKIAATYHIRLTRYSYPEAADDAPKYLVKEEMPGKEDTWFSGYSAEHIENIVGKLEWRVEYPVPIWEHLKGDGTPDWNLEWRTL